MSPKLEEVMKRLEKSLSEARKYIPVQMDIVKNEGISKASNFNLRELNKHLIKRV